MICSRPRLVGASADDLRRELAVEVGEEGREVGELDLVVQELLVRDPRAGQASLEAEAREPGIDRQRAVEHAEVRLVPDPVTTAELKALGGLPRQVNHGADREARRSEAHARAGVADDARHLEPGGVEAELRWVDEGDRDLHEVGTDILIHVMHAADIALLVGQPRAREDRPVDGIRGDVVVRIPERVASRLDGVPPEPPAEHLARAAREGHQARDVRAPVPQLAIPRLDLVMAGIEERIQRLRGRREGLAGIDRRRQRGQRGVVEPQIPVEVLLVGLAAYPLAVDRELSLRGDRIVRDPVFMVASLSRVAPRGAQAR